MYFVYILFSYLEGRSNDFYITTEMFYSRVNAIVPSEHGGFG